MVMTGGQDIYKNSVPTTKVTVYNENGFLADWPHLDTSRESHGCGHFINADNKVVSKKYIFQDKNIIRQYTHTSSIISDAI